ncbi:MAG: SurA N-terminal domain-containing protein [Thermodesulfobacteriota bacterium]
MSLNFIRNRHSWFIRGILILIAVAFIIGIGYNLSDFGAITDVPNRTAAKVNGEDVSIVNFYLMRDSLKRQFGGEGEIPAEYLDQINIIALNQLINLKLLAQKAKSLGFRVTDEELDNAIKSDPSFQIDGKFVGSDRYKQFVEQAFQQDIGEFENWYRERLLAAKFAGFLDETALITEENLLDVYERQNEKINLYYITFSGQDSAGSYTPGEEEIKLYYQSHKGDLKTAETRQIRYFTLSPETFEKNVTVTEDEISSYYNAYPEEFKTVDGKQVPLAEAKKDIESRLKAQKAEGLRQQFLSRLDNAGSESAGIDALAKEYSAETIKESGPFSLNDNPGDIPPMVTRQAFGTDKGKVAMIPVGTSIWVMEVVQITPPREKTFEEAKEEAAESIKREKSKDVARKKAEESLKKLKGVKDENLPAEAQKLGLELKETGFFSRSESVPQLNSRLLSSEAFELDPESGVPNRIYDDADKFYIISVKEVKSASPEDFNGAKDALMEQELQNQRSQVIQRMIQDLRRQAEIVPNTKIFPSQG